MQKQLKRRHQKKRASTYEKPVKFDGTFQDMIAISTTGAGTKKKEDLTLSPNSYIVTLKNSIPFTQIKWVSFNFPTLK